MIEKEAVWLHAVDTVVNYKDRDKIKKIEPSGLNNEIRRWWDPAEYVKITTSAPTTHKYEFSDAFRAFMLNKGFVCSDISRRRSETIFRMTHRKLRVEWCLKGSELSTLSLVEVIALKRWISVRGVETILYTLKE